MSRYIDADAVIKEIDAAQDSLESNNDETWEINRKYYKGLCWERRIIEDQPAADVVEVVRFKYCENYEPHGNGKAGRCKDKRNSGIRYAGLLQLRRK